MWFDGPRAKANGALLLSAGLAVATGLTFWSGFRATREWERSTIDVAERRGNEVVTLLDVALERDMRGGQTSVLLKLDQRELSDIAPYELADHFARGFARFPYLDTFFVWTPSSEAGGSTYVFHRADRVPSWDAGEAADDPYPVVFRRDPIAFRSVVSLARAQAARDSHFVMFESAVGGVRYQAVAQLMYVRHGAESPIAAIAGFLVDLEWVETHYFADFIRQIQSIIADPSLSIEVVNSEGRSAAAVGPPLSIASKHARPFPLVFADQTLLSDQSRRPRAAYWSARVGVAAEASRAAADRGAVRTLALLGLGALATLIGLSLAVRAARTAADLAAVQSEFVSAVSHEMKTPLSLIKLASDTLAAGRYASPAAIADYGRLMATEAQHLTRLIDNVLCYARINDSTSDYDFEDVDIAELVQESIDRLRPQFTEQGFDVQLNAPADPILVRADHLRLGQAFDNVIDNATKHAASGRSLTVTIRAAEQSVHVDLQDRGDGIPAHELSRVFEKFYRRKGTRHRGTGLGLAIVRRIVEDHAGTVTISSAVGHGTSVSVRLPSLSG